MAKSSMKREAPTSLVDLERAESELDSDFETLRIARKRRTGQRNPYVVEDQQPLFDNSNVYNQQQQEEIEDSEYSEINTLLRTIHLERQNRVGPVG